MRCLLVLVLLLSAGLAGCADDGDSDATSDIQVDETSGVILGIVVDTAVRPVAGVEVLLDGFDQVTLTDEQGRFTFLDVPPGQQQMRMEKEGYHPVTLQTMVQAGVADPELVRAVMEQVFSQAPFTEQFSQRGYLECSQAGIVYASAPCVHDYSGLGAGLLAGTGGCTNDGCLPMLEEITQDDRYFLSGVGAGWQTQIWELTWQASASATSERMGFVVSHDARFGSHRYAEFSGADPVRGQLNVSEPHFRANADSTAGTEIPPDGKEDLVFFISVRKSTPAPAVALQQDFEAFHTKFYYGLPDKDGWSVVAGDELPY